MIYIIALIITALFTIGITQVQQMQGMGEAWRIAGLILLLIFGCAFIFAGVIAPPGPRSTLIQLGAALLTAMPIKIAFIIYKNTRGW